MKNRIGLDSLRIWGYEEQPDGRKGMGRHEWMKQEVSMGRWAWVFGVDILIQFEKQAGDLRERQTQCNKSWGRKKLQSGSQNASRPMVQGMAHVRSTLVPAVAYYASEGEQRSSWIADVKLKEGERLQADKPWPGHLHRWDCVTKPQLGHFAYRSKTRILRGWQRHLTS